MDIKKQSIGDIFCALGRVQRVEDLPEDTRKFVQLEQVIKDISAMDISSDDKRKLFKTEVQSVIDVVEEKDAEYEKHFDTMDKVMGITRTEPRITLMTGLRPIFDKLVADLNL